MKEKLNPGILLLVLTGLLFIAGIFLVELRTARQISDYEAQLDTFLKQNLLIHRPLFSIRILRPNTILSLQGETTILKTKYLRSTRRIPKIFSAINNLLHLKRKDILI